MFLQFLALTRPSEGLLPPYFINFALSKGLGPAMQQFIL